MNSVKDLMDLTGRVAIVTGGGGHIGSTLCEALAELGANVAVFDCASEACNSVAGHLRQEYSVDATSVSVDLRDEDSTRNACDTVLQHYGRLDILVNCAAFVGTSTLKGWVTSFNEQSMDAWRQAMDLNVGAPFLLAQTCGDALADSGRGTVINIGSYLGLVGPDMRLYEGTGMGTPGAYAASKGGLLQLTRWLATVMSPHVRVNSVTPGGLFRDQPAPFVSRYKNRTPLRRMATEEDLKGAIAYLASDLSAYVTGQDIVVDGGFTTW